MPGLDGSSEPARGKEFVRGDVVEGGHDFDDIGGGESGAGWRVGDALRNVLGEAFLGEASSEGAFEGDAGTAMAGAVAGGSLE